MSFKPDTDDIREAPALYMINQLVAEGAEVTAYDPEAMGNVKRMMGEKIQYASDMYSALEGADALMIATEWSAFRNPDFEIIREKLIVPVIFDGRNLYETNQMRDLGFYYESIGREVVNPILE